MPFKPLTLGLGTLLLAGCSSPGGNLAQSVDPYFGEASKYNAAVQTIDPDPVYSPDGAQPGAHGEKAANATERYRTDRVKDVEVIQTTSGTSGGPQ